MIFVGIDRKGVKDVAIQAGTAEEVYDFSLLYRDIEPEIQRFKDAINKKLNKKKSGM